MFPAQAHLVNNTGAQHGKGLDQQIIAARDQGWNNNPRDRALCAV
jgi:hypothetical protein